MKMSREIKFRAKIKQGYEDAGEWFYFELSDLCETGGIPSFGLEFIDFNTLGQYIGIKDICDTEAFEDDIIKFDDTDIGGNKGDGRIFYCSNSLILAAPGYYLELSNGTILARLPVNFQIIGNANDNPELLKGSDEAIVE